MSDQIIQVAEPASPTKNLDSEQLTVGVNTVQRERIEICGAASAEIAWVKNATPASTGYAVITRPFLATDGTNVVSLKAANTAPTTGDTTLVVGISPQSPLPAGTNTLGVVNAGTGTWAVSGTVTSNQGGAPWTQRIQDATGTTLASVVTGAAATGSNALVVGLSPNSPLPAGTNALGTVSLSAATAVELLDSAGVNKASISAAGAIKVDGSAVTQPVSIAAHVIADQGTAAAASSKWPVELVDSGGVNVATVKAASTAIAATDLPIAVGLHPSSPLPAGTNALGTVTSNVGTGTRPVSGTVTSNQGTGLAATSAGWPVNPWGMADTLYAAGTTSAPLAGATIATMTPAAGTYLVYILPDVQAVDSNNIEFDVGATVKMSSLGGAAGNLQGIVMGPFRITLNGTTALTLKNTAAGGVSSVYFGAIWATQIA